MRSETMRLNRRDFLVGTAAVACVPVYAAGASPRVASPRSAFEKSNFGLILAPEDASDDVDLRIELGRHFRYLHVRARDQHGYYVQSRENDSGNLKGLLKKHGRRLSQDAVLHKPAHQDVFLYATRDLSRLAMSLGDCRSLGRFRADRLGELLTTMTGNVWEDIGLYTPKSFFSRSERRVGFDGIERVDGTRSTVSFQ